MAEQTFRSPGFFEQEIDLSQRQSAPTGIPGGVIGTAKMGPAFVPVTVGSFADFENKFGGLDANRFGPYAVNEFLKYKQSVTYLRVLGAGANATATDIGNTEQLGIVKNAGFVLSASSGDTKLPVIASQLKDASATYANGRAAGAVQFICAKHFLSASSGELTGFPVFSDNDSFIERKNSGETDVVNVVRAMIMVASGTRVLIADDSDDIPRTSAGQVDTANNFTLDDFAQPTFTSATDYNFKLIISSSSGPGFGYDDDIAGFRIMSASLDPASEMYVGKILNSDPTKFQDEQHLLYADFAVENELAPVAQGLSAVAILSGSGYAPASGDNSIMRQRFGRFDTRYKTPRTTSFISQPFGDTEYDLFHFETLDDGAFANDQYKVSIANIRASNDPRDLYGTFEIQIRKFSDTDTNIEVLESFPQCNLNPSSDRYIARVIGDKKVYFDFDAEQEEERRLVVQGKYPNVSSFVRIVMKDAVEKKDIPATAVPFGFRGVPALKTSDSLTDVSHVAIPNLGRPIAAAATSANQNRLAGSGPSTDPNQVAAGTEGQARAALTGSIVPPLPFRFKATRGAVASSAAFVGEAGLLERSDSRLYWGVKFERLPLESQVTNAVLNANIGGLPNKLVSAYTRFVGLEKMDQVVTGSARDIFNNNKFSLSRVALYNTLPLSEVSGTAKEHMLDAAYIRNGTPKASDGTIVDPIEVTRTRITLGTLVQSSSVLFNRFTPYAKFTNIFYGGFDGLNILDTDNLYMTDKASSVDAGGKASSDYTDTGLFAGNVAGSGKENNVLFAYREAANIMTDPMTVNTNILAIPGIRDSLVTDVASDGAKKNSMQIYVMDVPQYNASAVRLYDDRGSTSKPDVRETSEQLDGRGMDNNYTATYFPDVVITDDQNGRNVNVPPSVAALGALAYNDFVGYPWFAPAGFNRGALEQVQQVDVRLTSADRDTLYDSRINPIASFPNGGGKPTFVIFGQKTLQMAKTALDRVNVRRMLLEVKRLVVSVADRILFEPNTAATRASFVGQILPLLALVQAQAGIESFQVICDESNNSQSDVETNKMNGRIVIVPTRTVEFIAIDFIITNSGVSFE